MIQKMLCTLVLAVSLAGPGMITTNLSMGDMVYTAQQEETTEAQQDDEKEETEEKTAAFQEEAVSENDSASENALLENETKEKDKTGLFEMTQSLAQDAGNAVIVQKVKWLPIIILSLVVLLETAAIVYLVFFMKIKDSDAESPVPVAASKKKKKEGVAGNYTPIAGSHSIRIELLEGSLVNPETTFSFEDQILIGRNGICNMVFNDPDVSKLHARIYIQDGMYFVENLSLKKATYLADMQIQKVNRLEDGDTIQMGGVKFSVHLG